VKLPRILLSLSPDEYCVDIFKQIWRDYYGVKLYRKRQTQDVVWENDYPDINIQDLALKESSSKSIETVPLMRCAWISRQFSSKNQTVSPLQLDLQEVSQSQINKNISECAIQAMKAVLNITETVE